MKNPYNRRYRFSKDKFLEKIAYQQAVILQSSLKIKKSLLMCLNIFQNG